MEPSNKLKLYIAVCGLLSLAAVPLLNMGWQAQGAGPDMYEQLGPNSSDIATGIAYALLLAVTGYLLARSDSKREQRGNLALNYHLAAVVVANVAGLIGWLLLPYFGWRYIAWLVIVGGGSYGLHWLIASKNTKGINKQAAFK